tara:strand:+ start:61145 stop:61612 length:468 start_codon:yes stop_codon:yes gene_type:complete
MKLIRTEVLSITHKEQIKTLWNTEYPEKLNYTSLSDFEIYLEKLKEQSHILVVDEHYNIKGWYVDFVRNNEKWFVIIVASVVQGEGLGTKLLDLAKNKEPVLNGWVVNHNNERKSNGEWYNSPIEFYLKNKFEILPTIKLEVNNLSAIKIKWEKQ